MLRLVLQEEFGIVLGTHAEEDKDDAIFTSQGIDRVSSCIHRLLTVDCVAVGGCTVCRQDDNAVAAWSRLASVNMYSRTKVRAPPVLGCSTPTANRPDTKVENAVLLTAWG